MKKAPKKKKRATILDVAREAGVSTATVSRVINQSDQVSKSLRKRVQNVIDDLGYLHNRNAYNLRLGIAKRIGVIFADIGNPFFTSTLLSGIEDALHQEKYALILGSADGDMDTEKKLINLFLEEGIAGLIVSPVSDDFSQFEGILDQNIPLILVDTNKEDLNIDSVSIDNFKASYEATSYLIKLGHTRIAFIGGPKNTYTTQKRQSGYQQALKDHSINHTMIEYSDYKIDGGSSAMKKIIEQKPIPTAVLVTNDLMTLGALRTIHEEKLIIPDDISIIGFDDMICAPSLNPPLTAISRPIKDIGKISANLLIARINAPNKPLEHINLPSEIVIRGSCKQI